MTINIVVEEAQTRPVETQKSGVAVVYSEKLDKCIPIKTEPVGDVQIYNIGMGPGSWY